jgi:hypothetical protein
VINPPLVSAKAQQALQTALADIPANGDWHP